MAGSHDPASGALDCAGVVIEVLKRLGRPHAAASFEGALRPEDGAAAGWVSVQAGQALEAGDVLVVDAGADGLHVAVAVGPFRALSSARRLGVYSHPITADPKGLVGVYRPPPEPTS